MLAGGRPYDMGEGERFHASPQVSISGFAACPTVMSQPNTSYSNRSSRSQSRASFARHHARQPGSTIGPGDPGRLPQRGYARCRFALGRCLSIHSVRPCRGRKTNSQWDHWLLRHLPTRQGRQGNPFVHDAVPDVSSDGIGRRRKLLRSEPWRKLRETTIAARPAGRVSATGRSQRSARNRLGHGRCAGPRQAKIADDQFCPDEDLYHALARPMEGDKPSLRE